MLIDRSFLLDYGCLLKENLPFEKPPLKDLKLQENHSFLSKQKVVLASVSSCMLASLLSPLFPNYAPCMYNTDPKELDQLSQKM